MEKFLGQEFEDLKEMELSDDKRGNRRALVAQTVESNLPESFKIELPIFKGMPKVTIKDVADKLKSKIICVSEPCYKMVDAQTRQVGYYNKEGMLVYQRPARMAELQPRLFELRPGKTGTENK